MEILIVPEIASELRISETGVYRLIQDGHLKAINAGARRRVVSREELDRFIRAGGVNGPDPDLSADGAPSSSPAPSAGRPAPVRKVAAG